MNKIFLLCKVQFKEIFSFTKANRKRKIGFGFALLIIGTFLLSLSVIYACIIGHYLREVECLEYLPALFFVITSMVTLFTTIFQVKGVIFGSKDYDLLLSFPVSTWQIVMSKIIMVYLYEFIFTVILMLPADIYYFVFAESAVSIVLSVFMLFLIPVFPLAVATLIGFLISFMSERLPHKNAIQVILITAVIVLIFVSSVGIGQNGSSDVVNLLIGVLSKMERSYPLMRVYLNGCIGGDVGNLFLYIFVNVGTLALICGFIGMFYQKLNQWIFRGRAHRRFVKKKAFSTGNPFRALLNKEAKTYFNTSAYFLNTIIGGVLSIACTGVLTYEILKGNLILEIDGERWNLGQFIEPFLPVIICFFSGMTSLTSNSISMEGKNLWIIQSSPINYRQYFGAKLVLNQIVMGGCALVAGIVGCFAAEGNAALILSLIVVPQGYVFFVGVLGLIINLRYPKVDWTTEQSAVKNSASTFFSMLAGIALTLILGVLIFFISHFSEWISFVICTILFYGNAFLLYFALCKKAEQKMRNII